MKPTIRIFAKAKESVATFAANFTYGFYYNHYHYGLDMIGSYVGRDSYQFVIDKTKGGQNFDIIDLIRIRNFLFEQLKKNRREIELVTMIMVDRDCQSTQLERLDFRRK